MTVRARTKSAIAAALLAAAGISASASAQITTPAMLASVDTNAAGLAPLYVFDITSGTYGATIPAGVRVTGLAYDQATRNVYILARSTVSSTQSLLYSLNVNPLTGVGSALTVSGSVSNATSGGLAWDGPNNRLLVSMSSRLHAMDPLTGGTTQIRAWDFIPNLNGADIDPVSGSLFLVNSSATIGAPFNGRGIYRIDPPFDSSPVIKIANFPLKAGVPETDIDGCAAGHGVIFLSCDEAESTYRLNLTDLTYQATVTQPFTFTGALTGGATYVGSDDDGADVGVAIRNEAPNAVPPAGESPFLVHVRNVGSQTATGVVATLPLPVGTSFVSATGGATFAMGAVTLNAGDLAPGQGASFGVTLSSGAAFTATVSATTTAADVYSGNNSASVLSNAEKPDLLVTLAPPAGYCTNTPAGQAAAFAATVSNYSARATNATLTFPVPAGATFNSSSPSGVLFMGSVTIDLGSIAAGAAVPVTINITPGEGLGVALTVTGSAAGESNPADNVATASITTGVFSSTRLRAIVSSASPLNAFTGLSGQVSTSAGTLDSSRSLSGEWIATHMRGTIDGNDDLLVRTNVHTCESSVMAQEGVTPIPGGFVPNFNSFLTPGVNDAGDFGWSGRDTNAAATDAYAAKSVGGVITVVGREGSPIPALPGFNYGSTPPTTTGVLSSGGFTNAGQVYYVGNVAGTPAGQDEAAFVADGTISVAQRGLTTPAGAAGPLTDILNTGFYVNAAGTRYIYQATTSTGGSKTNAVVGTVGVADATAIVVQGSILPGFSSTVSAIDVTLMTPEGRWFVRGSNTDLEDWIISGTGNTVTAANIILRTGTTAATGTPITPGNVERWDPGLSSTNNLTANASNARGDVVVVGATTGDARSNIAFVVNGTRVIAREGDPVDANGNGVFDDDMFLMDLDFDDQLVLTNDACYALVKLRDRAGLCANSTTVAGMAVIRIPISCPADFDNSGLVDADDLFAFLDAWFAQNGTSSPCNSANIDSNGVVDADDLFAFLDLWFAYNGGVCP